MKGWHSKRIEALCPCMQTRVRELRERFHERTAERLAIIETARDLDRQREYVRLGVSKTLYSAHLAPGGKIPRRLSEARVLAVDMCPRPYLAQPKWNPAGRLWIVYGELAMKLGMLWGKDWDDTPGRAPYDGWDSPHVYLPSCRCEGEP